MALAVISPAKANPSVCVHVEQKKKKNQIWHKSLDDVIVKWLAVPHSRVCLAIIH